MTLEGLTVAEVVQAGREGLGLTQAELAQKLGVTSAYVARLEAGRLYPKVSCQCQQDFYWRLAQIVCEGWCDPLPFYANLVALDLFERQPELYLLLGRHFATEFKHELERAFLSRHPRPEQEIAPHLGAERTNATNS